MSYIEEFAKRVVINKLRFVTGTKIYCNPDYVERDGRKRKNAIKDLVSQGYIGEAEVNDGSVRHEIKNKAYNELRAIPVNLVAHWTEQRRQIRRGVLRGVMVRSMSDNEVKYLIENKDSYTFYVGKVRDFLNGYGEPIMEQFVLGTDTCEKVIDGWTDKGRNRFPDTEILVYDAALGEHIDSIVFSETTEYAMNHNLVWGLEKLGLVNKTITSTISINDTPMLMGNDAVATLPEDYSKWAEVLPEKLETTRKRIKSLETKLHNLSVLSASIAAYGGWEKFLTDYRGAVEEAVKSKDEKEVA